MAEDAAGQDLWESCHGWPTAPGGVGLPGQVGRRAHVREEPPLPRRADLHQPDPLLPRRARARLAAIFLTSGVRPPFFYGWLIVAIAFVTTAIGVNARTAFSLLFPPILAEFGWPRAPTAGAVSFVFLVAAVLPPL